MKSEGTECKACGTCYADHSDQKGNKDPNLSGRTHTPSHTPHLFHPESSGSEPLPSPGLALKQGSCWEELLRRWGGRCLSSRHGGWWRPTPRSSCHHSAFRAADRAPSLTTAGCFHSKYKTASEMPLILRSKALLLEGACLPLFCPGT